MTFEQRPEVRGTGVMQIPSGESIQAEGVASAVVRVCQVYLKNSVWWPVWPELSESGRGWETIGALMGYSEDFGFPFE